MPIINLVCCIARWVVDIEWPWPTFQLRSASWSSCFMLDLSLNAIDPQASEAFSLHTSHLSRSSAIRTRHYDLSCCKTVLHLTLKGSIFLKNRYFIIQEKFDKLIYGIYTIIKCGVWQPVKSKLDLSILKWYDFLSYLWINVANINSEIG